MKVTHTIPMKKYPIRAGYEISFRQTHAVNDIGLVIMIIMAMMGNWEAKPKYNLYVYSTISHRKLS